MIIHVTYVDVNKLKCDGAYIIMPYLNNKYTLYNIYNDIEQQISLEGCVNVITVGMYVYLSPPTDPPLHASIYI